MGPSRIVPAYRPDLPLNIRPTAPARSRRRGVGSLRRCNSATLFKCFRVSSIPSLIEPNRESPFERPPPKTVG